ncbi:MAG: hypothetical protein RL172_3055 [Bacteroidota bacterium]|jgi:hypothetical protein
MALLALMACNSAPPETMQMPGAYNMIAQSTDDGTTDTTYTTLKEFKIYTDRHMMYVNINPSDTVSRFGIGTYTADSGKVVEHVFYGASDSLDNNQPTSYTLLIEKTDKGFNQVIPAIVSGGKSYKLTEKYETWSSPAKTALDGAWRLTQSYNVLGKDTTANLQTQYKTFWAGHFMYGGTYKDSASRLHTSIGYGMFELPAAGKLKENVITSTYYQARGKIFDIELELTGTDAFRQTIHNADGSKSVEVYERLK